MIFTPKMGGRIVISVLQKDKGHLDYVCAEIEKRGIKSPMLIKDIKQREVLDLLQMNEYQLLIRLELARIIKYWKDVKEIEQ